MIRIYLDWNVISNLKLKEYEELNEFITLNKKHFQFPYSSAHFNDLMKSYNPNNIYFYQDFEKLEYLTERHYLQWNNERTAPYFHSPKDFFENEKNKDKSISKFNFDELISDFDEHWKDSELGNIGSLMKSTLELIPANVLTDKSSEALNKMFPTLNSDSNMYDLLNAILPFIDNITNDRDYYLNLRKLTNESKKKLDTNSGSWEEHEVIEKIDEYLKSNGSNVSFIDSIETIFKDRKTPINKYEFFNTAYLSLDMIGYKPEKLKKKTDNMLNIATDGQHAFYAAHCDLFVTSDKNLRKKASVLYSKLSISTKVIDTKDMLSTIREMVDIPSSLDKLINKVIDIIASGELIKHHPVSEADEADSYVIKLPKLYFNFFNSLVLRNYSSINAKVISFKKVITNYSDFTFYTEYEYLYDTISKLFGDNTESNLEDLRHSFIYEDVDLVIKWNLNKFGVILEKEKGSPSPILSYFLVNN